MFDFTDQVVLVTGASGHWAVPLCVHFTRPGLKSSLPFTALARPSSYSPNWLARRIVFWLAAST